MCAVQDDFKHWTGARRRVDYPIRFFYITRIPTSFSMDESILGKGRRRVMWRLVTAALSWIVLASCGGGGGGGGDGSSAPTPITVSGTVAAGAPLADVEVVVWEGFL